MSEVKAARPLCERLRGQHLLVTGSTGFLAKQFVEKILRSLDTVAGITLLVRDGRDLAAVERVEKELFPSSVFNRLRASIGGRFEALWREKIHVVAGDLTQPKLGLSDAEYAALSARVTLIVNSAATVTFDEQLDLALSLNTRGPLRLLQFAKDSGDLPFLHVSTCYVCGAVSGAVPEDFHVPISAQGKLATTADGAVDLDAVLATLDEEAASIRARLGSSPDELREALIAAGMAAARQRGWNDTYTLTKWLGEQLLCRERENVPLTIFRPAIIEGSFDEPEPGWIDGLRMADPLIAAYGRGKLDEFPGDLDTTIDLIPVDFVVNGMIASLPIDIAGTAAPRVMQCATSGRNPLILRRMTAALHTAFQKQPMHDENGEPILPAPLKLTPQTIFLEQWERKRNRLQRLHGFLGRYAWGQQRARKLNAAIRQVEQIIYFAKIYAPYTSLDVQYQDDHLRAAHAQLTPEDQATFPCDTKCIDWEDYIIERHVPGVRNFVLGTGLEPNARIRGVSIEPSGTVAAGLFSAKTIYEAFAATVGLYPDKAAFQVRRGNRWLRYSYREAEEATGTIVKRLGEYDLALGARVALIAENGPEWVLTYLAIQRAGMTAVPLDPQLPPADAWAAVRFVAAGLVCAGANCHAGLAAGREDDAAPLVLLRAPFVPQPGASRDPAEAVATIPADQPASILFTSGTTVAPKAVPLTHANLLANARDMVTLHPHGPNEEFLSVLPLYHVLEFTGGFLYPLSIGATITYVERISGPEIVAAMQATGTTIMIAVPRLLELFRHSITEKAAAKGIVAKKIFNGFIALAENFGPRLGKPLFGGVHRAFGGRLRILVSGGSALAPETYQFFARMGFKVYEGYGLTETAPVLTMTPPNCGRAGSSGTPMPSVDLDIREPDASGVGAVWVRGPNVFSGYLGNAAATAEVFKDGWFHTGDLGRLDADGYLHLTGRSKDLIVTSAGKNVYPDEVEVRYQEMPSVSELCVLGMPAASGAGEAVHAVVVLDTESGDAAALETAVRAAAAVIARDVPGFQRIAHFHFWTHELPRTSTLKAKRNQVREMLLADSSGGVNDASAKADRDADLAETNAAAETETSLAFIAVRTILARQTRVPEASISRESNLLSDLGIDSIGKIDVLASIEEVFGFQTDDDAGASSATVADLLTLIGEREPLGARKQQDRKNANGVRSEDVAPWLLPARWSVGGGFGIFLNTYVRARVYGREHVPREGAFILAPNHASHLDSPAVLHALRGWRRVWMVGAEDYFFRTPFRRFLFGQVLDMVPFDRQRDGVQGLRRCAELLQRGAGLLLFPEGTRSPTDEIAPFKTGVAMLAAQNAVPVIPVRIRGAHELLAKGRHVVKPGRIDITFGAPIIPPPLTADPDADRQEMLRALTDEIETAVRGLACPPEKTVARNA